MSQYQKRSIYLAGPITGLTYGEARHGWRKEFGEMMARQSPHIECFSPMRQKDFLEGQEDLRGDAEALDRLDHALARPHGILTRDFNDVTTRDAVVACFLGATRVSIGTVWEIGVAYAHKKPLIVIMEPSRTEVTDTKIVTEHVDPYQLGSSGVLHAELEKRGYKHGHYEIVSEMTDPATGGHILKLKVPGAVKTISNPHDHVFITHTAGYVVPTLEEAALIAGSILTPGL